MRSSVLAQLTLAVLVAACDRAPRDPAPGVALALAEQRADQVSDLRYHALFDIPATRDSAVTGEVTLAFNWRGETQPLVLDFRAPADHVLGVRLDGDSVPYRVVPDHIVIPAEAVADGAREVTVRFCSTDAALNRNAEYLYALFVPDRASTAFPVFEQPDLKGRFTVELRIPAEWEAVSNGALVARDSTNSARHHLRFAETEPISTYLMAFAAGEFQAERATRDGRAYTMYHRETDRARLRRNAPAIFDLHAAALRWLEDYTGVPYPFGKFDFVAIPSFQFGGMEHPGAIWYNASGLFLDESAGRPQQLGRASLIAHETAHMWFGDLVTMRWFNDVWMKEVFANFMAAKIAGPSFPDIDLKLRFFQAHHPTANGIDRTLGANPIRQPLENLREAGSLYGGIIYQKAPIVMQQLETLVGEDTFREGLREYVQRYRYANATWPELIAILDSLSPLDLEQWSEVWVEQPGRPEVTTRVEGRELVLTQSDPWPQRDLRWPQRTQVAVGAEDGNVRVVDAELLNATTHIPLPDGVERPRFLLGGADGVSYGRFALDSASREFLLAEIHSLPSATMRAVAWQALYEEMLDGGLAPTRLLDATLAALPREREELLSSQILGILRGTYWGFLNDSTRLARAAGVEASLWEELARAPDAGRKGSLFSTIVTVTLTDAGLARLERLWAQRESIRGLPLNEPQYLAMAQALAVRGVPNADSIVEVQAERITNPDRRARFEFLRPALSADSAKHAALRRSFQDESVRRQESWVLAAQGLLHHPLRADEAVAHIYESLELVEEIQRTGDIFFPLRWMNATLGGHQSAEAAAIVRRFLDERPNYPPRLRGKLLQAADDLFRAARIVHGWEDGQ